MTDEPVNWSVFTCSQNLSAILNDPNRGKQRDFFTRHWGESFVDVSVIPPSQRLEYIPNAYFIPYYKKLLKRYRKLQERKSFTVRAPQDPIHTFFPQLAAREAQLLKPETSPIPRIFFTQNFAMSNSDTFREVYGINTEAIPSKTVQDRLSHYLDMVEVGLAQQISKKSSAFFSAISTQDKVAEKVNQALVCVRKIKGELAQVKDTNVELPLKIIKLAKKKSHKIVIYQKLQLMATVHQAQRAIQSLLGNSDYVGALDLISTTQEVLRQELQGLISFRHLDSQLVEIRNAIEKMLRAELERNLSSDLNRPIDQMESFIDKDRLVSIILGHLRLGKVAPIVSVLAKEISTAMTTTCKQTLIEAVSESDSKSDSLIGNNSVQMAILQLPTDIWIKLISNLSQRLVLLLQHIKEVILLFQSCADSAICQLNKSEIDENDDSDIPGSLISDGDEPIISMQLFSNFTSELGNQLDKTTNQADEKFTGFLRYRQTWLIRSEFFETLKLVRNFLSQLEIFYNSLSRITSFSPKSFRYTASVELKNQSTEFFRDFHQRQTEIVNKVLDRERWRIVGEEKVKRLWPITDIHLLIEKAAEVSNAEINFINIIESSNSNGGSETSSLKDYTNGVIPSSPTPSLSLDVNSNTDEDNNERLLDINSKALKNYGDKSPIPQQQLTLKDNNDVCTAEIFFILLTVSAEYCNLVTVTGNAEVVLGFVELLRSANARISQLVLGAGAVELKMVRSITVANLAVVVRGLCLLAGIIPEVKISFTEAIPSKNHHLLKHVDAVQGEITRHSQDVENKMVSIVTDLIDVDLHNWEAKPPVPSPSISNVSKSISKFREAIGPVLTNKQISELFLRVDRSFRSKLKDKIASLGILKDGGPRHGVVTSEMMHYTENLKKLNVLPANIISNSGLTNELWSTSNK